ncbi:MAG: hypothetical protein V1839_00725 [archaeon]
MKTNPVLVALAIAGFLVLASVLVSSVRPQKIAEEQMDIIVSTGKMIGFDVGTDAVHFGKVPANNEARRKFIVSSGESKLDAVVQFSGDIGSWVTASPQKFSMEPGETQEIMLVAHVPPGTEPGKYYGKMQVILKSALF